MDENQMFPCMRERSFCVRRDGKKQRVKICEDYNEYRDDSTDNVTDKGEGKGDELEICSSVSFIGWDNPFLAGGTISKEADMMIRIWREGGGWRLGEDFRIERMPEGEPKHNINKEKDKNEDKPADNEENEKENGPKKVHFEMPKLTKTKPRKSDLPNCCSLL